MARGRPKTYRAALVPIRSWAELPQIMDFAMASRFTGFTPEWLAKLSHKQEFPGFQIGQRWFVDKDDLMEYKDHQRKKMQKGESA